jgi:hypothetical protein
MMLAHPARAAAEAEFAKLRAYAEQKAATRQSRHRGLGLRRRRRSLQAHLTALERYRDAVADLFVR